MYPLPDRAPDTTKNMSESHQIVSFTPDGDKNLAYQLVLPKNWIIESELEEGSDHFPQWRLIGLFAPRIDPLAPFISVSVTTLPFEVNLEDWTDFFAGIDGWEVFHTSWYKTPYGYVVDTGAYKGDRENRDVMRVMVTADDRRIFMTSGVAQAKHWDEWKDHFLIACSTFELEKRTGNDELEPLRDWTGGDPFFGVSYPASWQLHVQSDTPPGKSAVEIQLIHGQEMLAYVLVKSTSLATHSGVDLQKLVDQALQELEGSGFQRTGNNWFVPASDDIKPQGNWRIADSANDPIAHTIKGYQGTAIISGRVESRDVEARLGFRILNGMAYSIYLISVRQEKNFLLWMRSKKCFEIVRLNLWNTDPKPQIKQKFAAGGAITDISKGKWGVVADANWQLLGKGRVSYASVMMKNPAATADGTTSSQGVASTSQTGSGDISSTTTNRWMDDKEAPHCMLCAVKFTVLVRRHHCRNCGKIFCFKCSGKRLPIPNYPKPQRVCDQCFNGITVGTIKAIGSFPSHEQQSKEDS